MKFLLSDKSLGRCDMLKAVLESNGIECVLKNEFMPFSTSGVAVFGAEPVCPELWVIDDEQHADAMYGDGVQVGAYATFLLASAVDSEDERTRLLGDLQQRWPDAVDHSGRLLATRMAED